MKRKVRHIVFLLIVMGSLPQFIFASTLLDNPIERKVYINCIPTLNSNEISNQGVLVPFSDTVFMLDTIGKNWGEEIVFSPDLVKNEGDFEYVSYYDLSWGFKEFGFKLILPQSNCYYKSVDYGIDSASTDSVLLIEYLNFTTHELSYGPDTLCKGAGRIYPVSNLQLSDLIVESVSLTIDSTDLSFDAYNSSTGTHRLDFKSDYCLVDTFQNVYIAEGLQGNFEDTINVCGNNAMLDSLINEYSILNLDLNNSEIDANSPIEGNYLISPKTDLCYFSDTVYISNSGTLSADRLLALPDTLKICSGSNEVDSLIRIYDVYNEDKQEVRGSFDAIGAYTISEKNDFCLTQKEVYVNLLESAPAFEIEDTLKLCDNNDEALNSYFNEYAVFTSGNTDIEVADFSGDGYYTFRTKNTECPYIDSAVVIVAIPTDFEIQAEDKCDNSIIRLSSANRSGISEIAWSNGDNGFETSSIENTIAVTVIDENNCITEREIELSPPLVIEELDFSLIKAKCWENGEFLLDNLKLNYDNNDFVYLLENQLNGQFEKDFENVPEGSYLFKIIDENRGCEVVFENKIIIEQDCLNDYPVFTPNADGKEDEYFIPYEGEVTVYDRNGNELIKLPTPAYWNGRDASGAELPMGNYVMVTDKNKIVNITIIK